MVDFFIVGQPKSGTTALSQFLDEHPEIGIAEHKEPSYFATDLRQESDNFHGKSVFFHIRTAEQYQKLFDGVKYKRLHGEASTNYLYSRVAAENIFAYNPDAKIIIMLRSPVDFMHSLHMQYINENKEPETDFTKALGKEAVRKAGKDLPKSMSVPSYLLYMERASYYRQVKRYIDIFPRKNILILITEKFQKDNRSHYKEVLSFLGADENFTPEFQTVHGSKAPRNLKLNRALNNQAFKNMLLNTLGRKRYAKVRNAVAGLMMKPVARSSLDQELRRALTRQLRPDVDKLEKLTGKDLASDWSMN